MKKILAIFLSALIICIGVAPVGAAASADPKLKTKVIEGGYLESSANASAVKNTTFTVVVRAPKGIKNLVGAVLYFNYDPAVVSVAKAGLAGKIDADGNENPNFPGMAVNGQRGQAKNEYSVAWIPSGDGISKNAERDFIYITFNVLDIDKTETSIKLYADEFITEDGNNANDVKKTKLLNDITVNFDFPKDTPNPTTVKTTATAASDNDDSKTDEANNLLQLIRDLVAGNGVKISDFKDAMLNITGNAELADIIEQLVDENLGISDAFKDFLDSLGINLDKLLDILRQIIDFIMGLFNKEDTSAPTTAVQTTAANLATTAEGSSSSSEQTGDMGVALAATVCVLSSAAFVLTRKKKEIL